jgi:predicted ATPase/DNA-binding SARP family transcriptional activator
MMTSLNETIPNTHKMARSEVGLTVHLLGNFEAWVGNEPLPKLRSRQGVRLLALLALKNSREVERTYLAETLWPESNTEAGLALLRRTLTDLRSALGVEALRLQSPSKHTLRLNLTHSAYLDCTAFEHASKSDEREKLEQSISLYRGPLLEDLRDEWVRIERLRLQQIFLDVLMRQALHVKTLPKESILLLKRSIDIDPLREDTYRALMEIQAKTGDMNGATATYQQLTRRLKREIDRLPDEETYLLYRKFLREGRERVLQRSERLAQKIISPSSVSLPHPLTTFFGRDKEKESIGCRLLNPLIRLITITGLGGSGKTRLAIEIAQSNQQHFSGGVWFLPLADCRLGRQAIESLAKMWNLPVEGTPPLLERLAAHINTSNAPCLLVLDNAEHLLAEIAQTSLISFLQTLLQTTPHLTILVTTRQPLRVSGEQEFPLAPLAPPDSIALFLNRAQAVRSDLLLDSHNTPQITTLCQRLEGIPLALEMAAIWLRTLSPEQIEQRLEQRLEALVDERRDAPQRHRSIRGVLSWSYDLLPAAAQILFASLSVFCGSWDAAEAGVIAGLPHHDAISLLSLLEEHGLIFRALDQPESPRYRLLEVVREFAREQLVRQGQETEAHDRHVTYFSERAMAAHVGIRSSEQAFWHAQMDRDRENIYAALDYLAESNSTENTERFLALIASLSRFWERRGYFTEAYVRCQQGIALHGDRPPTAHSTRAVLRMGLHHMRRGEYSEARVCCLDAISFFTTSGDHASRGDAYQTLGNLCAKEDNQIAALSYFEQGLADMRQANDPNRIASLLGNLGSHYRNTKCYDKALGYYQEQLALRRHLGDHGRVARSLGHLASVHFHLGDLATAKVYFDESTRIHEKFQNGLGLAANAYCQGQIAYLENNLAEAEHYFRESLRWNQTTGLYAEIPDDLLQLAHVAEAKGDFLRAFRLTIVREGLQKFPIEENVTTEEKVKRLKDICLNECGMGATHRTETDAYLLPTSEHLEYALQCTAEQQQNYPLKAG